MVVCGKKQKRCLPEEVVAGDCWIALSLAQLSGLILVGRVGKHTDELAQELSSSTEAKTDCKEWGTDGWQGYGRVLPDDVDHYISKTLTQRLERTNSILRYSNRTLASTAKQVWQDLGTNENYPKTSHHLLQLDLATFVPGNYGGTASRVNRSCLDLE